VEAILKMIAAEADLEALRSACEGVQQGLALFVEEKKNALKSSATNHLSAMAEHKGRLFSVAAHFFVFCVQLFCCQLWIVDCCRGCHLCPFGAVAVARVLGFLTDFGHENQTWKCADSVLAVGCLMAWAGWRDCILNY
jgi:hypothetical protein